MSIHQTMEDVQAAHQRRLHVNWVTIGLFAIVMAYIDGFWVTSLQGAVGAVERSQQPFTRWLHESTLMLPLYVLAVLAGLLLARRWVGQSPRKLVELGATALLITVISTGVGIAQVAASSAYDYRVQSHELALTQNLHHSHPAAAQPAPAATDASSCSGLCAARRSTLIAHVRAVKLSSAVLLISNLILVAWILALRSDRLWRRRMAPSPHTVSSNGDRHGQSLALKQSTTLRSSKSR